ncbi:hypothetical protein BSKO_09243 [Bryopsis sp. KO-2023]|nr:hypothetical protein BSKO_09243 [Bryopsis sp. KO-2023]
MRTSQPSLIFSRVGPVRPRVLTKSRADPPRRHRFGSQCVAPARTDATRVVWDDVDAFQTATVKVCVPNVE